MIETENGKVLVEPLRFPKARKACLSWKRPPVEINTKALISMKVSQNGYAPKTKVK